MAKRYLLDNSKRPAKYTLCTAIEVLGPNRIRYEFDNGTSAEYDTYRPADEEAREEIRELENRGAKAQPAA